MLEKIWLVVRIVLIIVSVVGLLGGLSCAYMATGEARSGKTIAIAIAITFISLILLAVLV